MTETEPNEPPTPDEDIGDEGEDYGAKVGDDRDDVDPEPEDLKLTERAALLDLDGTLIDSNYQHAIAWYHAFRAHEIVLPLWRIHRHIGMGGDQLVPAITDERVEQRLRRFVAGGRGG